MKLNKLRSNKSGFTLLEIIIVIIIIGILASVALPKLFSTVDLADSAEAMNGLGTIRQSLERCRLMKSNDAQACDADYALLDIGDPGLEAGAKFTYVSAASAANVYTVTATLVGGAAADVITLTVDESATPPTITMVGTAAGKFSSINQ